jgi:hypothetical protein
MLIGNDMRTTGWISLTMMVIGSALLAGCTPEAVDDADFLEEVRSNTSAVVSSPEQGLIDPDVTSPPVIELSTDEFDMGMIAADKLTFKDMPISNPGGTDLVITNITTSCPCTQGKMVETTIPAGGEGILRIQLDPYRIPKFYSKKRLTIMSNDPKNPQVFLFVTARVEGEIKLPEKEITFDAVEAGDSAEKSIRLVQTMEKPTEIQSAKLNNAPDFMTLEVVAVPEDKRTEANIPEWEVIARISEESKIGRYNAIAAVTVMSGRRQLINVPVRLTVLGDYAFAPAEITVRNLDPGDLRKSVTTLTAKVPLEVLGVKSENSALKVTYEKGTEPNSYTFDLVAPQRPDKRLQKDNWEITMLVDGKEVVEVLDVVALISRQKTSNN